MTRRVGDREQLLTIAIRDLEEMLAVTKDPAQLAALQRDLRRLRGRRLWLRWLDRTDVKEDP